MRPTLLAAALALALASTAHANPRYRVLDLGFVPGGTSSVPNRFGHTGALVGWSNVPGTFGGHAVRWDMDPAATSVTATDLGGLAGFDWSYARGMNSAGWIVGHSNTANPQPRAVLWRDGQVVDIERAADGNANIYAMDINDANVICGFLTKSGGGGGWDAVIWTEQTNHPGRFDRFTLPLAAGVNPVNSWTESQEILNDGRVYGRTAIGGGGDRATLWENDATHTAVLLEPLPTGSLQSMPGDINELGDAVGYTMMPYSFDIPTRWSRDAAHTPIALPLLPGDTGGRAFVVDPTGTVVLGQSYQVDNSVFPWTYPVFHMVMWKDGVVWDLNQQLDGSGSGWIVDGVNDVNASGWIAATATKAGAQHAVLLVPVTEVAGAPGAAAAGVALAAPWPNPSRGEVRVSFTLPRAANARLRIVDAQGRAVATLVDGASEAGRHDVSWSGADASGRTAAPGLYFALLESEGARALTRIARVR